MKRGLIAKQTSRAKLKRIQKSFVYACLNEGVMDASEIGAIGAENLRTLSKDVVAGHKAAITKELA